MIREMLVLSPNTTEEQLKFGLFNGDGRLKEWDLEKCNLEALPESFGLVRTTGDLWLNGNQLQTLPESFGSVTVGGGLELRENQLRAWPRFPNVKGRVWK